MTKGDVVQFNENSDWCGALGIIREVKVLKDDIRYMVGVPIPKHGTAFIFVMDNDDEIEFIGKANLVLKEDEEVEDDGQ